MRVGIPGRGMTQGGTRASARGPVGGAGRQQAPGIGIPGNQFVKDRCGAGQAPAGPSCVRPAAQGGPGPAVRAHKSENLV